MIHCIASGYSADDTLASTNPVAQSHIAGAFATRLLEKAVEAKEPVKRLQWTVTWFVAGLQHVFQVLIDWTPGGSCRWQLWHPIE